MAIKKIQTEGGKYNFVVFLADEARNYYIQFSGEKGKDYVYAEAVSNNFLEPEHALDAKQQARLEAMGWQSQADGNYQRTWLVASDARRDEIAAEVERTFREVYGIPEAAEIQAEIVLE